MPNDAVRWCALVALLLGGLGFGISAAIAGHVPPPPVGRAVSEKRSAHDLPVDKRIVLPIVAVRAPTRFGAEAYDHVRVVTGFGPRHPGRIPAPGWSRQLDYIEATLESFGLEVERDTWTDRKELVTFCNLMAKIPGKRRDIVVLACHHDTKCAQGHRDPQHNFHFVGANDGGSGVGVLLALAPVLLASQREATIKLVFFDGEESLDWDWNGAARALFGSRRFAKKYLDAMKNGDEPPIVTVVLLDMVGRSDLHLQEELYSTPRLRSILWSAAVACGHHERVFGRAEASIDDHWPFIDVGIPALDMIDLKGNPYWHTAMDTLENVSPMSLQVTGDLVLTMLPEIERVYVRKSRY